MEKLPWLEVNGKKKKPPPRGGGGGQAGASRLFVLIMGRERMEWGDIGDREKGVEKEREKGRRENDKTKRETKQSRIIGPFCTLE